MPPDSIIFNEEVALDLTWLNGKAVLHLVDNHTHFNSAAFLKGQKVEDVWTAFLQCRASTYSGFPSKSEITEKVLSHLYDGKS